MTRRDFYKVAMAAGASTALAAARVAAFPSGPDQIESDRQSPASRTDTTGAGLSQAPIVLFSKHLPDLNWSDLGAAVRAAGFGGVDLTVRPGGHVEPARVNDDLAPAVRAIRDAGSQVPMLTTGLTRADDPAAGPTFTTARAVGVPLLKAGYYRYAFKDVRAELADATRAFAGLARLAADAGVTIAYHNHSGYIGAPVWDALQMVEPLDARAAGYYFDIRHAVVEGGDAGWRVATQMVAPRLRMLAAKDFYWDKRQNGRWQIVDCPLGDGMVDWPAFFSEIARTTFSGPISIHLEYETGGRTPVEKTERALEAFVRDKTRLESWIDAASRKSAP